MATNPLSDWKQSLISLTLSSNILTFGSFTLKSGRVSPYFINCGLFSRGELIESIASSYARTLNTYSKSNPDFTFDVLFGPAYKGIPLCATTCLELARQDRERWGSVGYAFNRKEAKDHGEGGVLVGESIRGKRVVIIDDVMTSGKAIREAIDIIKAQGGTLVGIVVAVDREERMPSQNEREGRMDAEDAGVDRSSAIGEVRRETGVPVIAVLTLRDIITGMEALERHDEVKAMREYYERYGARD
jgi:orotate phosphoribosyltransferase